MVSFGFGFGLGLRPRRTGGVIPPPPPVTIALSGSSTFDFAATAGVGTSNARVSKSTDGSTFAQATAGAFIMEAGHLLATALNRDVRWLAKAIGGTTTRGWNTNGDANIASLIAAVNAYIAAGGTLDAMLWQCNFNDAGSKLVVSRADQAALLRSVFAKIRAGTNLPNLKILVCLTQKSGSSFDATSQTQTVLVRQAELDVAADANNYLFLNPMDLATYDGTHQTQASYLIYAARAADNLQRLLAGQQLRVGPIPASATAVSTTQTDLNFALDSGDSITPATAITGVQLTLSDSTVLAPSAAVRQDNDTIRLTHANLGGLAGSVSYLALGLPDMSGAVFDNGTPARPAIPTKDPLPFAATSTPTPTPTGAFSDNFNDAAADASTRSPQIPNAATYAVTSGAVATSNGRLRRASTGATEGKIRSSYAPVSLNYDVSFKLTPLTNDAGFVTLRTVDANNYVYLGYSLSGKTWSIGQNIANVITTLNAVPQVPVLGQTYAITIKVRGNLVALLVNGVVKVCGTIPTTSAGNIGAWWSGTLTPSDTVGCVIDDLQVVEDPPTAGQPTGKSAQWRYTHPSSPPAAPPGWQSRAGISTNTALNGHANLSLALNNPGGGSTGWTTTNDNVSGHVNSQGGTTGNGTGRFPDNAMLNYAFNGETLSGSNGGVSIPVTTNTLAGLDPTKVYDLIAFASRNAADRVTTFTMDSTVIDVDGSNNTTNVAPFLKFVPNGSGVKTFTWGPKSPTLYGNFNCAQLIEYFPA